LAYAQLAVEAVSLTIRVPLAQLDRQQQVLDFVEFLQTVPLETFESFFQERFVQEAVKLYQLKLIVYDPEKEVVIAWRD
jgi:hypothetical protein